MTDDNTGWVKLHRKLRHNPLYTNSRAVHCWIECLLRASHKKRICFSKRRRLELEPGQFLMGRDEFGKSVGMSGSTAWFWILQFEVDSMVDIKKTSKGSIVKVKEWKKYQGLDSKVDSKKTQKKQQKNTNKNDKNVKNDKSSPQKAEDWNFNKELTKLKTAARMDLKLVGYYFQRRAMCIPTKAVFSKEIARALAEIKTLKDFPKEKIVKAFDYAEEKYPEWTIETVGKVITKI